MSTLASGWASQLGIADVEAHRVVPPRPPIFLRSRSAREPGPARSPPRPPAPRVERPHRCPSPGRANARRARAQAARPGCHARGTAPFQRWPANSPNPTRQLARSSGPRVSFRCRALDLMHWTPMVSANIETLQRGYDALNRGDLSIVLALLDPDWSVTRTAIPEWWPEMLEVECADLEGGQPLPRCRQRAHSGPRRMIWLSTASRTAARSPSSATARA
jgi:hypothetical protein